MKRFTILLIVLSLLIILPGAAVFAQYSFLDAQGDLVVIAQGLSDIFGPNLGSMAFLGDPVGFSTIPHFEIGAGVGFVLIPTENVAAGSSLEYDFGEIQYIPLPSAAVHGKLKIKKMEVGLKFGGIPELESKDAGLYVKNTIAGVKVRRELYDKRKFLFKIGASAGLLYEYTGGTIQMLGRDTMPVYIEDPLFGNQFQIADLTTTAGFETTWTGHTLGGEAQGNFQILFFNFFGGLRLSKTFGSATTELGGNATLTAVPGYFGDVVEGTTAINISEESKTEGFDTTLFGGLEVKLLIFALTGRGGYNLKNDNITVDIGGRLQF